MVSDIEFGAPIELSRLSRSSHPCNELVSNIDLVPPPPNLTLSTSTQIGEEARKTHEWIQDAKWKTTGYLRHTRTLRIYDRSAMWALSSLSQDWHDPNPVTLLFSNVTKVEVSEVVRNGDYKFVDPEFEDLGEEEVLTFEDIRQELVDQMSRGYESIDAQNTGEASGASESSERWGVSGIIPEDPSSNNGNDNNNTATAAAGGYNVTNNNVAVRPKGRFGCIGCSFILGREGQYIDHCNFTPSNGTTYAQESSSFFEVGVGSLRTCVWSSSDFPYAARPTQPLDGLESSVQPMISTGDDTMGWINLAAPVLVILSIIFQNILDRSCHIAPAGLFDKNRRGLSSFLVIGQLLGVASVSAALAMDKKYVKDATAALNQVDGMSFEMTWGTAGNCFLIIMLAFRTASTTF
ncbi:hypothetical protein IAR50_005006 [Cryptococcus sp. DSM 104548]